MQGTTNTFGYSLFFRRNYAMLATVFTTAFAWEMYVGHYRMA